MTTATTAKVRVPLALAEQLAHEAIRLLAPACERLEIAGSIRRRRADVGDIELLAVPQTQPVYDLFLQPRGEYDLLDERCQAAIGAGALSPRLDSQGRAALGERYKRLVFHSRTGSLPLDLFAVKPPAQWGALLAIRTGPHAFSKRLVTPREHGGAMPFGVRQQNGALWNGSAAIATPEEEDFFRALGLVWIPPERRTDDVRLVRATPGGPGR